MSLRSLAAVGVGLLVLTGGGSPVTAEASLDDVVEVDIMDLTSIDWKPGAELPAWVTELSGRTVLIQGYMHQSVVDDTNRFPFVSDVCQCVARLMPHHFIDVHIGDDTTGPVPGSLEIMGRFNVGERVDDDGFVTSLYRLRGRIF